MPSFVRTISKAKALRNAKELSIEFNGPDIHSGPLWPVVWGDKSDAYLCTPRPSGESHIDRPGNPYKIFRTAAILRLRDHWGCLSHMGTTPGDNEIDSIFKASQIDAEVRIDYARAAAETNKAPNGASL